MTGDEQQAVSKFLSFTKDPVIVELGAYTGEDGPLFESMIAPSQQLLHIMVEPDPRNLEVILNNKNRPLGANRRVIAGAIAAKSGVRTFHFSEDSRDGSRGSGSLLEPTGHIEHFPTIKFAHSAVVPCFTLDEIFEQERLPKIDLLWVDIQGAEKEMITGGKRALANTRYCFMEAESIELYKGQALKPDLIAMLPGWSLVADFGYNILLRNLEFDS